MSTVPHRPKPSGVAYLIPVGIWILFSVVAVVLLVMGFSRGEQVADDLARIDGGTTAEVELDAGEFRVWIEEPTIDDGSAPPPSTVTITRDGAEIPVDTYDGTLQWQDLEAVYTFAAPESGLYEITAQAEGSSDARFAVGQDSPLDEVARGVLLMVVVGTVGFLIALVISIVLAVKRGRSKRQIREANLASYPPQGGYPGGGYGQPGGGYGQPGASAPGAGGPTFGAPPPPQQGTPPPAGWSPPPPPS